MSPRSCNMKIRPIKKYQVSVKKWGGQGIVCPMGMKIPHQIAPMHRPLGLAQQLQFLHPSASELPPMSLHCSQQLFRKRFFLVLLQPGTCGECEPLNTTCYKHSQCCKGLYCGKGFAKIVGKCSQVKGKGGTCYQKAMCKKDCKKKWYQVKGKCT